MTFDANFNEGNQTIYADFGEIYNIGGSSNEIKIGYVELLGSAWQGEKSPFSQVVNIAGTTPYSQVDLTPSIEQLSVFYEKDLALVAENEDGIVTVYALGDKPQNDYTMQVTITEVSV